MQMAAQDQLKTKQENGFREYELIHEVLNQMVLVPDGMLHKFQTFEKCLFLYETACKL